MLPELAATYLTTLAVCGPAEWAIHKHMLHSKKRPWWVKKAAESHNDDHHGAYRAPAHYYRDATNEHVTYHFGLGDVAAIIGIAAGLGYLASKVTPLEAGVAIAGTTLAAATSYGAYESSHREMHVIGPRRLQIGRIVGDYVQDVPDDTLRLPKPTLDELCNTIEDRLETGTGEFRLRENCEEVLAAQGITTDLDEVIDHTVEQLAAWEQDYLSQATPFQKIKYTISRKIQRFARKSKLFNHLDNHHFLHHKKLNTNLNVVHTWWDWLIGTYVPSNEAALLDPANKSMYLCPNSSDTDPFVKKRDRPVVL